MENIKIISKEIGQFPQFETMESSLENMQEKVGGYIERVILPKNIDMWVNEEGMIDGQSLNIIVIEDGIETHHIFGDIFFASFDDEGGTIGLDRDQVTWLGQNLKTIGISKGIDGEEYFVFGLLINN